jgi:hypothetical protein
VRGACRGIGRRVSLIHDSALRAWREPPEAITQTECPQCPESGSPVCGGLGSWAARLDPWLPCGSCVSQRTPTGSCDMAGTVGECSRSKRPKITRHGSHRFVCHNQVFPELRLGTGRERCGFNDADIAEVIAYKTARPIDPRHVLPEQAINVLASVGIAAADIHHRPLTVLDFGGGCGVHYKAQSST